MLSQEYKISYKLALLSRQRSKGGLSIVASRKLTDEEEELILSQYSEYRVTSNDNRGIVCTPFPENQMLVAMSRRVSGDEFESRVHEHTLIYLFPKNEFFRNGYLTQILAYPEAFFPHVGLDDLSEMVEFGVPVEGAPAVLDNWIDKKGDAQLFASLYEHLSWDIANALSVCLGAEPLQFKPDYIIQEGDGQDKTVEDIVQLLKVAEEKKVDIQDDEAEDEEEVQRGARLTDFLSYLFDEKRRTMYPEVRLQDHIEEMKREGICIPKVREALWAFLLDNRLCHAPRYRIRKKHFRKVVRLLFILCKCENKEEKERYVIQKAPYDLEAMHDMLLRLSNTFLFKKRAYKQLQKEVLMQYLEPLSIYESKKR